MSSYNRECKVWYLKHGNKALDLSTLPRCQAKASTTGDRCKRAARKNCKYCGIHSGKYRPGAAPKNKQRLSHGLRTKQAQQERAIAKDVLYDLAHLIKELNYKSERISNDSHNRQ